MWLLKTDKVDVAIFYLQSMPQPLRPVFYNQLETCYLFIFIVFDSWKPQALKVTYLQEFI